MTTMTIHAEVTEGCERSFEVELGSYHVDSRNPWNNELEMGRVWEITNAGRTEIDGDTFLAILAAAWDCSVRKAEEEVLEDLSLAASDDDSWYQEWERE